MMPDILQLALRVTINATDLFCLSLSFAAIYVIIALVGKLRRK